MALCLTCSESIIQSAWWGLFIKYIYNCVCTHECRYPWRTEALDLLDLDLFAVVGRVGHGGHVGCVGCVGLNKNALHRLID